MTATESDKSRTRGKGALRGQSRPTPVTTLCCDTTTSDMEVSPNTEDSTGGVAGFVRNTSIGEEEIEAFNAPEVAVDEERKLREERERREEDLASKTGKEVADAKDVVLEEGKFAQVRRRAWLFACLRVCVVGGWWDAGHYLAHLRDIVRSTHVCL